MNYTINQVEDGILTALRNDVPLKAVCRKIDTYAGPPAPQSVEDFLAGVLPPACLVYYLGSEYEDNATTRIQTFSILVITRNLRGGAAARKGVTGETGAYEMIEMVKAALKRNMLGLDIAPLRPVREVLVAAEAQVAIYGIEFSTFFHEE